MLIIKDSKQFRICESNIINQIIIDFILKPKQNIIYIK